MTPPSPSEPVTPKGRRTREALLEAGAVVAERDGLAGLTVAGVARQAGVAKGSFYVYFRDREAFIDAMHQRFYAQVTAAMEDAVRDLPPGLDQVRTAMETYLDVCLELRAVKALVLETRTQSNLTTTMEERLELLARLTEPNLRAAGVRNAPVAARMVVAMTAEAAIIELEAKGRVPSARRMLHELADRLPTTA